MIMLDRKIGVPPGAEGYGNSSASSRTGTSSTRSWTSPACATAASGFALRIEDRPGSIKEVADIIRKHGFGLQGVLTTYEGVKEGYRKVVIRTHSSGDFNRLQDEITSVYRTCRIKQG